MVLVGHVTKDGSVAGPRVLEHLVDVVLQFEGDRHSTLRMVRGVKNRFGPADEVGCFELRDDGHRRGGRPVRAVPGPAAARRCPGTAVTVVMEGKRPLLAEVQALVAGNGHPEPAPRGQRPGLLPGRDGCWRCWSGARGVRLHDADVYTATVGGMRITEPAADLAVALAVASARRDVALPPDLVVLGEVGLAGEVRRVTGVDRRLAEAARLGFTTALVPPDSGVEARRPAGAGGRRRGAGARQPAVAPPGSRRDGIPHEPGDTGGILQGHAVPDAGQAATRSARSKADFDAAGSRRPLRPADDLEGFAHDVRLPGPLGRRRGSSWPVPTPGRGRPRPRPRCGPPRRTPGSARP